VGRAGAGAPAPQGSVARVRAPGEPGSVSSRTVVVRFTLTQEFLQELAQIAVDGHVRLNRRFVELGGVDIDLDFEGAGREGFPVIADLADVETGPKDQQNVCILHGEVSGAVADGARASAIAPVIGGDEVMGPGGGHGYTQPVEKFVEFSDRMGGADAGTGEDHGALCISDAVENFTTIGIQRGVARGLVLCGTIVRGLVLRGIIAAKGGGINGRGLYVNWNIEPARTRTSTLCEVPCALK